MRVFGPEEKPCTLQRAWKPSCCAATMLTAVALCSPAKLTAKRKKYIFFCDVRWVLGDMSSVSCWVASFNLYQVRKVASVFETDKKHLDMNVFYRNQRTCDPCSSPNSRLLFFPELVIFCSLDFNRSLLLHWLNSVWFIERWGAKEEVSGLKKLS